MSGPQANNLYTYLYTGADFRLAGPCFRGLVTLSSGAKTYCQV